jgi:hypothetical protein
VYSPSLIPSKYPCPAKGSHAIPRTNTHLCRSDRGRDHKSPLHWSGCARDRHWTAGHLLISASPPIISKKRFENPTLTADGKKDRRVWVLAAAGRHMAPGEDADQVTKQQRISTCPVSAKGFHPYRKVSNLSVLIFWHLPQHTAEKSYEHEGRKTNPCWRAD